MQFTVRDEHAAVQTNHCSRARQDAVSLAVEVQKATCNIHSPITSQASRSNVKVAALDDYLSAAVDTIASN